MNVGLKQRQDADDGGEDDAMPDDRFEDVRLLANLVGGGGGHADTLGVDHLAHDAASAVGGADQYLSMPLRGEGEGTAVGPIDLAGGDFLEAAEQGVAPRVGAREEDAQPTEDGGEEWVKHAGAGKGVAKRRIEAAIASYIAQSEHEGDGRYRNLHLKDGPGKDAADLRTAHA